MADGVDYEGLDGNAIAGLLYEVFGMELTDAHRQCIHCGAQGPLAETEVFLRGPGTVVRCRVCRGLLMVFVRRGETVCVDLRGLSHLQPER